MAAEVESMFSVRENAWHDPAGKFTLPDYPDGWDEARRLAGLEWEPVVVPAFVQRFAAVEGVELPEISYEEAPDTKLVTRSDSGLVLGHVGSGWTPVLNRTLGEFAEAVLELPNTRIATAGSLAEGRNVWVLIELDEPYRLTGADDSLTLPYLAVLNGHDGGASFRALPTSIRVVCRNTYRAAHDLTRIGVPEADWREPSDEHPWGPISPWPIGQLIAHDGAARWVVEEPDPTGPLPAGACAKLPPEATL